MTAFAAHKEALAAAARGAHPGEGRLVPGEHRLAAGPDRPAGRTGSGSCRLLLRERSAGRAGFQDVSADLFPTLDTVIAYRLLFGIYSGIVPDGIEDLVASDIDWAGDASVLLSYVKRRTAAESLNLPRRAVRLLEQWLGHSALLRGHAGPATGNGSGWAPAIPAGTRSSGTSTGSRSSAGHCATT